MAREDVEAVRQVYERFSSGDIEGVLALLTPDFELRLPDVYPEGPGGFRGPDGMRQWVQLIREVWDEWRFDVEQLIDAGASVVALVRLAATGGASGVHVEREVAHVWTLRERRPARVTVHLDRARALAAAGIDAGEA